jgi:hypothetical protein
MRRASNRTVVIAAVLVLGGLVPRLATAQTAEDRETARRTFDEGKARRDAGDAAGALESFRAADAIMNAPTTKLAVARAYLTLGKLVEAREAALKVAQIPVAPNESQPFQDARVSAAHLAGELAGRIPSLEVSIQGEQPEALTIDGVAIPREAWTAPRRVNPGKHVVAARCHADHRASAGRAKEHDIGGPPLARPGLLDRRRGRRGRPRRRIRRGDRVALEARRCRLAMSRQEVSSLGDRCTRRRTDMGHDLHRLLRRGGRRRRRLCRRARLAACGRDQEHGDRPAPRRRLGHRELLT